MLLLQVMSSDSSSTRVRSESVLSMRLISLQPCSSSASFSPEPFRYRSTHVPIVLSHLCISSTTLFSSLSPISLAGRSGGTSLGSDVDGNVGRPSLPSCDRQRLISNHLWTRDQRTFDVTDMETFHCETSASPALDQKANQGQHKHDYPECKVCKCVWRPLRLVLILRSSLV
jgi:hypothetical protein